MSPNPDGAISFETAYGELQQIVAQLEGNVELERAIELLERGTRLVAECERIVGQAELRVTRLTAESAFPAAADVEAGPAPSARDA